ncbi:hypothetical protein FA15DRAFT_691883 [Coprinopsis marcescibilis]|uniref:Uncharacterized protein n=1 Tax=Coprinopsis marcescibilis TaxID=230819 RepID=A0A5C3L6Q6_COPMA|nr:hypothetical protein FA15DRAFT_691883 [Coprinopsis marcescibilis]
MAFNGLMMQYTTNIVLPVRGGLFHHQTVRGILRTVYGGGRARRSVGGGLPALQRSAQNGTRGDEGNKNVRLQVCMSRRTLTGCKGSNSFVLQGLGTRRDDRKSDQLDMPYQGSPPRYLVFTTSIVAAKNTWLIHTPSTGTTHVNKSPAGKTVQNELSEAVEWVTNWRITKSRIPRLSGDHLFLGFLKIKRRKLPERTARCIVTAFKHKYHTITNLVGAERSI